MIHPADTKHDTIRSVLLCEISPAVSQERKDGGAEDENLTNTERSQAAKQWPLADTAVAWGPQH